MSEFEKRKVKCPRCKQEALYAPENPFRPFCSERCRLIDLGAWANEDFRVPVSADGSVQDFPAAGEDDEE